MNVRELFDLTGRTAIVTGASRGMGVDIAVGLAEAGADVVVCSRKRDDCAETVTRIESEGRRGWSFGVDLGNAEDIERFASEALAVAPRIDILVNNAATIWGDATLDYPIKGWDRVFDLNIRGLWLLTQAVARGMRDHGGSIVNISSISAERAATDATEPMVAYNASKGAVNALTRDLAVKLAQHRIRVNAISPGPFLTDNMKHIVADEDRHRAFLENIPLGHAGGPDDLKGAVVFLASAAAGFITGANLVVDGGSLCS
jgi:NAD(P)-dependent dehydrogenase (short-subunit alcohol dehydrogenase family)